ncbi:disulfide bond formation protein DsbB [Endobacter medicaginis]|uniref:Disulfide bond formation protein B n=1 Tax=Endobacter medicaginis TaxID=1181271 RepID=A0A839UWB6_9PROT|nr:disulfide bond formation protein B [Endobacter medicaginis]MBB3172673.1 disulfide bond formation protein DsbB [Endobacter medicaginis]MCX5475679.1 disulfide bond formation protein B [Endobacter medicaginis]NVN31260.1 disulfide bond formation protein B [Endobacter medicaginis]
MRSRDGWRLYGIGLSAICLLALGTAWWAQHIAGMAPCPLCLWERWPYRIGLLLGLILVVSPRALARWVMVAFIVVMLCGAGLAAVHIGVEQKWWASPLPSCHAASLHGSASDMLSQMPAHPAVPCDEPSYPIPAVPVSFATFDLICTLLLVVVTGFSLSRLRRAQLIFFGRS